MHKEMRSSTVSIAILILRICSREAEEGDMCFISYKDRNISSTHESNTHTYTNIHTYTRATLKSNFVYELGAIHIAYERDSQNATTYVRVYAKPARRGFGVLSFEYGRLRDRVTEPR